MVKIKSVKNKKPIEAESFEEQYPIEGKLVLSTIQHGKIFQIVPLVSLEMSNDQIAAELKVARINLNEAVNNWKNPVIDRLVVKDAIIKCCSGMTLEHQADCDCVGCNLLRWLELEE